MTEFSIIAVFFVGLLGGVHCLGMCGSIVGILTAQLPKDGARWPFHLAYNSGRIASYTLAGLLAGAIGQAGLLLRRCGADTAYAVCAIQLDADRAWPVSRRNLELGAAHRADRQCRCGNAYNR